MTQLSDRALRDTAQHTGRSLILSAPAGSGKTALLTSRFLALLAEVKHPRQVLAVTFTRKAAAEMEHRITATLDAARTGTEASGNSSFDQRMLGLARSALDAHSGNVQFMRGPGSFLIDTFHGFCASIVRGWPLEAGMPAGAELLDESEQQALADTAVRDYLQWISSGRGPAEQAESLARQLAAADNNVRIISRRLSDILRRRDRLIHLMDLLDKSDFEDELERRVEIAARKPLRRLHDYFYSHSRTWHGLKEELESCGCKLAERINGDVPGSDLKDIISWQSATEVFLTAARTVRKAFRTPDFPPGFKKTEFGSFITELPAGPARDLGLVSAWPVPEGDNVGVDVLTDTLTLAGGAMRRYSILMRKRGSDFLELELAALRALKHFDRPSESLIFFHERLRHILVDEAQDLNDTQVRILSALAEGWEPGDGRTIFLVGDPKQSVYRFRRAEVSLFDDLMSNGLPRIDENRLPLESLELATNFRSRPALVDVANRLFAHVMSNPDKDNDEVDFARSTAARENCESAAVTVCAFNYRTAANRDSEYLLKHEARVREAAYVARATARLREEAPDATIGILIPARTNLSFYVKAFEELGVPVNLMEGAPMLNSPAVRHLLNLFKAMLRPYDDVAWAGVIRAPWCLAPGAALAKLARADGSRLWSGKIIDGREVHPETARFLAAYEKVKPDFGRVPYAETLQRLWEELDGPCVVSRDGPTGLAESLEFFKLLRLCPDGAGEESLRRLEHLLERSYTPPDPRAAFSLVSMMTIHKAKGLEFDHVFAVGLDHDSVTRAARRTEASAFTIDRLPGPDRQYLASCATDRRTGARKLAASLLAHLEKGRILAEQKRLFYVAVTRARESLTMTGLVLRKKDTEAALTAECPINWVKRVKEENVFEGASLRLLEDPSPPDFERVQEQIQRELKKPPSFRPAPLPYVVRSPSLLEDESAMAARPGAEERDPDARVRGIVIHNIMDTLAKKGELPCARAVACTLAGEGMKPDKAQAEAPDILAECERTWNLESFRALRQQAVEIVTEWPIEDYTPNGTLRVGRVDMMLRTRDRAMLLDYKSGGEPGQADGWIEEEARRYRGQMRDYIGMAARVLKIDEESISGLLLFTSVPILVET